MIVFESIMSLSFTKYPFKPSCIISLVPPLQLNATTGVLRAMIRLERLDIRIN